MLRRKPGPSRQSVFALLALWVAACDAGPPAPTIDEAVATLDIDGFLTHMAALGDDGMEGRQPGTAGYGVAVEYVVREVTALGLQPGGTEGTFLQPISFRRAFMADGASFLVDGTPLQPDRDFAVSPRVMTEETDVRAPLVFAGYGISAPYLGYDDLAGIDVRGKLVVVLAGAPQGFGSLERTVLSSAASRDADLIERGAAGVIEVRFADSSGPPPSRPRTRFLPPENAGADPASEELPVSVVVPVRVLQGWLEAAGRDLTETLNSMSSGTPASFELGIEGHVRARYRHEPFESPNVAALLAGSDPELADEHLVITAHLDHLGVGIPLDGDSIYNGTLDNASGSAALLTLAKALTRMDAPRRSILFLWVTAEESGLLGSHYFARFPTVRQVVANQNVDGVMGMIAAATDVLAFGYEHSNLSEAVDFAVARSGDPVSPDPTPDQNLFIRSDQYSFVRQGIPAIWVQAGRTSADPDIDAQGELDRWIVERYHKPTDDNDQPIDLAGVRAEFENNLLVTWHIVNAMGPIRWDAESFLYQRFAR